MKSAVRQLFGLGQIEQTTYEETTKNGGKMSCFGKENRKMGLFLPIMAFLFRNFCIFVVGSWGFLRLRLVPSGIACLVVAAVWFTIWYNKQERNQQ